ncbi:hypothetical protein N9878_01190 [bacterium]|nr:hypothetical protein [bacterium]
MALSNSLQSFHAYAQYALSEGMKTGLFKVPTLLAAVANKQSVSGSMGEPGASAIIGKPVSVAKRKSLGGSTQKHIFFQTSRVGGGKYLGEDGTTSSTGTARQDKQKRSTAVSWSFYEQPISLRNNAIRMSGDGYAIGSLIEDAVQMAMNEANEQIAGDLWNGSPTSQASDVYDDLIGVDQWVDDNNTIGSIDRSSVTGFNGVRTDSATTISLSTIDDAALNSTNGLSLYGGRSDMAITTSGIYNNLKQEALASGGQLMFSEKQQGQAVGFEGEYINYNNTMICFDPYATNAGATANYFLLTDSSTWCFETHSAENWRVIPFKNLADDAQPGSDDLTVSKIRIGMRFYNEQPWKSRLYADAS